jgi:type IV pilus assembly protein PilM
MRLEEGALALFPVPSLLSFPAAGVDISESGVKCVFLRHHAGGSRLLVHAEIPLPRGTIHAGDIEAPDKLVEVLRTLRLRYGIRYANTALSERKAYLYQAIVPFGTNDIHSAIEAELETHVPLPPREVVFDYEPIKAVEGGLVIAVTAYAKRIVQEYEEVFTAAGVTLRGLEIESHAIARAVASSKDDTAMIIDFGRRSTRATIVERGIVAFTSTFDVGGETFTAAIMRLLNADEAEAEKIKNERGFLMNDANADVVEALLSAVSVLKEEIGQQLNFWNSSGEEIPRDPVSKIIICGGSAKLKGFPEYLERALGLPVLYANVWKGAFSLDDYVPVMPFSQSLGYATAIGLAKRGSPNAPW